jgi:hypothetical protein
MRFQQLFGDTDRFAINIALRDDPAPPPGAPAAQVASWGELELWVDGLCLTQHAFEGSSGKAVTWYLLPFFEWLDSKAVELLNREPFAYPIQQADGGTAIAWLNSANDGRPVGATSWDDDEWLDERYSFWQSHALRAGMPGAAVPHIVFHRVGDDIEVSWDNEGAPPPRRGLRYVNPRGARLVDGRFVAETLRSALREFASRLREFSVSVSMHGPLANGHGPGATAWRWLLPTVTAGLVEARPRLLEQLSSSVPSAGAFVPHSLASSVLRGVAAEDQKALDGVESVLQRPAEAHLADSITRLRCPSAAPRWDAWKAGYRVAERVREVLGWGADPLPNLRERLVDLGIEVKDVELPAGAACAALAFADEQARIAISWSGRMSPAMKIATALGHLLLDAPSHRDFGIVSSPWIDAPTVARAKAFGAMLLMPEERCRMLAKQSASPEMLVKSVMKAFSSTRSVTSWHLFHLRLLGQDDRDAALEGWSTDPS